MQCQINLLDCSLVQVRHVNWLNATLPQNICTNLSHRLRNFNLCLFGRASLGVLCRLSDHGNYPARLVASPG